MRIPASLFCLALPAAAASASALEAAPTAGRSITSLAAVPLRAPGGAPVTLGSRVVGGKPTLISIWASWCPPCIAEAPHLAAMRRHLGSRYNFISINRRVGDPDPDQPPEAVARFLARAGLGDADYVIADDAAYRRILGADLKNIPKGKIGIPRVYLFDRHGRQIHTAIGFEEADAPALERRLSRAIVAR